MMFIVKLPGISLGIVFHHRLAQLILVNGNGAVHN